MSSLLRTVAGALLLAAPLLGHAQTPAPDAAAPRFYVGLAAYHSNYQNLSSWRYGATGFRVPVQLTAGYQLRPRLALELGAAYSGRTATYSSVVTTTMPRATATITNTSRPLPRALPLCRPWPAIRLCPPTAFRLMRWVA